MAPSVGHEKPWYSLINIDLIYLILSRSIFHPYIAWLIPVCLLSVDWSTSHPHVVYTSIYATIVTIVSLLKLLDRRFAYGSPRTVDWDEEVVVITGGASGLGRILVETYGMRGVSVAALDVNLPGKKELHNNEAVGGEHVRWIRCDVSSLEDVQKAKDEIERELGSPTILINNAGIMHGAPLLSLTPSQFSSTLNINLLSHFHTLHTFLPSILSSVNGGTIVTIASVLGKLGASHLTDYSASKAGLLALHSSLTAELSTVYRDEGGERVRTILVAPGQLATPLFAGLETPSSFFGPVVEPVELAKEIVRMIDGGRSGEINLPLYARWIGWLGVLPPGLRKVARNVSGVDRAMEGMQAKTTRTKGKGEREA